MPRPMSPTDALFLMVESREHPMHVGGLQLFRPPEGADAVDAHRMYQSLIANPDIAATFRKRARRSASSAGQWAWEPDTDFDIEHHVRHNALPKPGRVLELLSLCSRLHSTLLDRHRPLWEAHLIEGLADGRLAMYFKIHHSVMDGVTAMRVMQQSLSRDAAEVDMPPPWIDRSADGSPPDAPPVDGVGRPLADLPWDAARTAFGAAGEAAGLPGSFMTTLQRSLREQAAPISFSAPRTILNVPITGARRVAAQSWPMERIRLVAKASHGTVNDVILAMSSGALRSYLLSLDALPNSPLIAMVPVALRPRDVGRQSGNAVGAVMCNLGTQLADPADRLETVRSSMTDGKAALSGMTQIQILAMTGLGMSPLVLSPLLRLTNVVRPPFNLIISNVPGPRFPLYWNGLQLDGLFPFSIPTDGQALNITCTTYVDQLGVGLTGCRRSVPHLQRLLGHLDDELTALEQAVGVS
jgi:diacylglycerol O-acyltransferase / wax synthase